MVDTHSFDARYREDFPEHLPGGGVYLLKWLQESWSEAARGVVLQFLVFYAMMLVGFGFLYLMMRSTARLREIRKNVAQTLREQGKRTYDVEDYNKMYGGGMYF